VDSGASNSIISDKLVHSLGLKIEPLMSTNPLIAATGQQLCNMGKVTINLYVKGLKIVHSFIVVKNLFSNFLIGADFLRKNSAVIDYFNNIVTFYDGLITVPLQCFHSIKNCEVFIKQSVFRHFRRYWFQCVYHKLIAVARLC